MKRRIIAVSALVAALTLILGATFAFGGGRGLIFDDGKVVKPGSLDDGKELLSQTTISLTQAVKATQAAATGQLGQVDLEHFGSRVVYSVDVGSKEVRIDATDGSVASIQPQD
jgi:uncharacterized membrane protein YkoI